MELMSSSCLHETGISFTDRASLRCKISPGLMLWCEKTLQKLAFRRLVRRAGCGFDVNQNHVRVADDL